MDSSRRNNADNHAQGRLLFVNKKKQVFAPFFSKSVCFLPSEAVVDVRRLAAARHWPGYSATAVADP
jgi:hypothetical protein